MKLNLTLTQRVLLFICISFVGFFMTGVLTAIVLHVFGATSPSMRIVTVLQDILVFILPAVVTALLVTRQPATLLCIDRRPPMAPLVLAIFTLLCSIPAMNYVIWLNANVPLPEGIASTLKSLEANAEGSIELIIGSHDVPNLVVAVLIVGVFAGVSEEIMFRGGFQRLLSTGGVGVHAAIWITAVVFSILHLQFYGFVPRMLLGASSDTLWCGHGHYGCRSYSTPSTIACM